MRTYWIGSGSYGIYWVEWPLDLDYGVGTTYGPVQPPFSVVCCSGLGLPSFHHDTDRRRRLVDQDFGGLCTSSMGWRRRRWTLESIFDPLKHMYTRFSPLNVYPVPLEANMYQLGEIENQNIQYCEVRFIPVVCLIFILILILRFIKLLYSKR